MGCQFCREKPDLQEKETINIESIKSGLNSYQLSTEQIKLSDCLEEMPKSKSKPVENKIKDMSEANGQDEYIIKSIPKTIKEIDDLNDYDYEKHSWEIFQTINNLRENPEIFIDKIIKLVKNIDEENDTIEIVTDQENVKVSLSEKINPLDAIHFLRLANSVPPFLWSNLLKDQAESDLTQVRVGNLSSEEFNIIVKRRFSNSKIEKLQTDFIVSPINTVLILFLLTEDNRRILFSEVPMECGIVTMPKEFTEAYSNFGNSLFYFVKNSDLRRKI